MVEEIIIETTRNPGFKNFLSFSHVLSEKAMWSNQHDESNSTIFAMSLLLGMATGLVRDGSPPS